MTAPNYPDKDEVYGTSKEQLEGLCLSDIMPVSQLANVALRLWEARDSAIETAAMQDEAIQKTLPGMAKMREVITAARESYSSVDCAHCQSPSVGHPHENWCATKKLKDKLDAFDSWESAKVSS